MTMVSKNQVLNGFFSRTGKVDGKEINFLIHSLFSYVRLKDRLETLVSMIDRKNANFQTSIPIPRT